VPAATDSAANIVGARADWKINCSASGSLMTELTNRACATLRTTDPPRHDRLRALIQHAIMKRKLESLGEPIHVIARGTVEELRGERQFDVKDLSVKFTVGVPMAALDLPNGLEGEKALVDEATVHEKAAMMVHSDPHTRAKGPAHRTAGQWMHDYPPQVVALGRAAR
jgi:cytochrome P450